MDSRCNCIYKPLSWNWHETGCPALLAPSVTDSTVDNGSDDDRYMGSDSDFSDHALGIDY